MTLQKFLTCSPMQRNPENSWPLQVYHVPRRRSQTPKTRHRFAATLLSSSQGTCLCPGLVPPIRRCASFSLVRRYPHWPELLEIEQLCSLGRASRPWTTKTSIPSGSLTTFFELLLKWHVWKWPFCKLKRDRPPCIQTLCAFSLHPIFHHRKYAHLDLLWITDLDYEKKIIVLLT